MHRREAAKLIPLSIAGIAGMAAGARAEPLPLRARRRASEPAGSQVVPPVRSISQRTAPSAPVNPSRLRPPGSSPSFRPCG